MDNRDQLLNCALNLFAARGYAAVGVQEIVNAAGVTKPTLYHYFGSKHGLLEAILGDYFAALNQLLRPAAAYSGDLPLTLKRIAAAYFDFASHQPVFYRFQLALWFAPGDSEENQVVTRFNRVQYTLVADVFAQSVTQHGNMRGRHQAYATTFIGMINTYIGMALNGYTALDDRLLEQALHQFQHGIYS